MGKMRVYELAQQLGMESKEFILRLKEMNIEVKSAVSSLSEEEAEKIKNSLGKHKVEKVIEEARIKPTVIRRRVKKLEVEEKPPEPAAAPEEPKEVPLGPVKPGVEEIRVEEIHPILEELAPREGAETIPPLVEELIPKPWEVKPEPVPLVIKKEEAKVPLPEVKEKEEGKAEKPKKSVYIPPKGAKLLGKKPLPYEREEIPARGKPKKKSKKGTAYGADIYLDPKAFGAKVPQLDKELEGGDTIPFPPPPLPSPKPPLTLIKPKKTERTTPKPIKRKIRVLEGITVFELSRRMGVKSAEVIKKLIELGLMATINQTIDNDAAALVAQEFSYEVESIPIEEEEIMVRHEKADTEEELVTRPPVVTVMGHVDHGKTSLLDAIRKTNLTDSEIGGITQHIGAYHVSLENGNIVFIDTPGHEAFAAMRARGAKVTDIVVLVVAADDGVMSQTVEAVNHAKAAGVPILVAINKIDKPNAEPQRVKQALSDYGLIPEEWGGTTIFAEVSAKQKKGIKELLEVILLQAEILELKANPNRLAKGTVIEAKLDKGKGPVGTVLIQEGTLRVGDSFVSGINFGRVRAMMNDLGVRVEEAGPSMPVEVVGFSGVPNAGDPLVVLSEERKARQVGIYRQQKLRETELSHSARVSLEGLHDQIQEGELKELRIVLKGDVQGSIEALKDSLQALSTKDIKLNVIHSGVSDISQSDVMLASASDAIIIGFGVKVDSKIQNLADQEGVEIRLYEVIYNAISEVRSAMEGLLAPTLVEKYLGKAEVRNVFQITKFGTVAGCYITDGKVTRNARVRLSRNGNLVYEGKISSLKRFKDEVKEAQAGYECGIGLENHHDIQIGDTIEAYIHEEVATKLE
ncbi:MAG: translation initiation factor IF-2 [Proteobacteria bacterium]|nr:translation initiation factor IF-2 [Pseudomonadota bacterium]